MTTMYKSFLCFWSGDACGVDAYLPVTPPGTTYSFYVGMFIGMAFTCISRSPGVSVSHCPVAQCGEDDQWTTNHVVSCTGILYDIKIHRNSC
jgi:hypothetical protein